MILKYREPGTPRIRDYTVGAVLIFALLALVIYIFGTDWKFGSVDPPTVLISIAIILFMGLRSVISRIYHWQFARLQARRDELARHIANDGRKDFFLYLRPFNTTGKLPITLANKKRGQSFTKAQQYLSEPGWDYNSEDLETELARALEPCGPLIGLGRPGEHVGAGRIETDDANWQSRFRDLASRALAIFVVPGLTEGTQWDLTV